MPEPTQLLRSSSPHHGPVLSQTLNTIISNNTSLRSLDLSCNVISEEGGRMLREGLSQNSTLQSMDMRQNPTLSIETIAAIEDLCKKNKLDAQRARRELFEAQRALDKGL